MSQGIFSKNYLTTNSSFSPLASISVATYNITHMIMLVASRTLFWHTRKRFVVHLIRMADPDILCLQEDFPPQLSYIVRHTGYASISYKSRDLFNKERDAILYKHSLFSLQDSGQFFLSATPERKSKVLEARSYHHCTWAKLKHHVTKKELFVFNAHFPVPIKDESRAVIGKALGEEIRKISQSAPFVLCGDFNTWPRPWFYDALGKDFIDTFHLQPKAHQVEYNTRQEWPGRTRKKAKERLDYIFIPESMKKGFLSYKIFRNKVFYKGKYWPPSDHCPVRVELAL